MFVFALLFLLSASVVAKQNDENDGKTSTLGNFLESTRRTRDFIFLCAIAISFVSGCDKQLVYKVVPLPALSAETFRPYANTSAESEEECARKCIERTIFCAAARFLDAEKACQFSAKYIDCSLGETPKRSSPENIIHCVQCGTKFISTVR